MQRDKRTIESDRLVNLVLRNADTEQRRSKDSLADGSTFELAGRRCDALLDREAALWVGAVRNHLEGNSPVPAVGADRREDPRSRPSVKSPGRPAPASFGQKKRT